MFMLLLIDEREQSGDLGMSVGEIADALGFSQPATSRLVKWSLRKGCIEAAVDKVDGRRTVCKLSHKGRDCVDRVYTAMRLAVVAEGARQGVTPI